MNIPRKNHIEFFTGEIEALEESIKQYFHSNANDLCELKKLYVGLYQGFDEKRGNIIIKFRKGSIPRIKQPYFAFTLPQELASRKHWGNKSYIEVREKAITGSDVLPIYLTSDANADFTIVGFANAEISFIDKLEKGAFIVIGIKEPPYQYLANLKEIVSKIPQETSAGKIIDMDVSNTGWYPENISDTDIAVELILKHLIDNDEVIIQGPPGTGKTWLMSLLCAKLIDQNKSILTTALTNRALIELAEKEALENACKDGKVYKTNISVEEKNKAKGLKNADKILPTQGALTLTTYYKMSFLAAELPANTIFDFVILEEASQSYLATIAACKILGRKLIIVGDPLQLPPIVVQNKPERIHEHIKKIVYGLETYAYNSNVKSFRITQSYRLPKQAVDFTGIFYENKLISKSPVKLPIEIQSKFSDLFSNQGGVSVHFSNISSEGNLPATAISLIKEIAVDLHLNNPEFDIAILTPFVETAKRLQEEIYPILKYSEKITIETIDRIQGLTTDITIFLIPFNNFNFCFHLNRFNVATSRAKLCTLIITDNHFKDINPAQGLVSVFWDKLLKASLSL